VTVEGTVVGEPKLLEKHGGPKHAFGGFLGLAHHMTGGLATKFFQQTGRRIVQVGVSLVGDNLVQIVGDGAHVAVDRPLVVVQHHDQALGLLGYIVERLKTYAVGEGGVPGKGNDVFFRTGKISGDGHAKRGGERGAGMARSVAVMIAFGAQGKAIQAARLAHGIEPGCGAR
jgi:hypothetical protein